MLSGCSAPQSTVSITYSYDGEEHTATAHPGDVECTDTEASSLGLDDPQYSVRVTFGDNPLGSYGSAWVHDERIVYFTVDEFDIERDGDRIRVASAPGTVKLIERSEGDGPIGDFDVDGASETEGTLSIDLLCAQ